MITALTIHKMLMDLEREFNISQAYINTLKHSILNYYILKLSTKAGRLDLLIDVRNRIFLPISVIEKSPKKEDRITTYFKKFKNAKVINFYQLGRERIICIKIRTRNGENYNIYIEIYGKGNIIITDENNKILNLLYEIETKKRKLKIGSKYEPSEIAEIEDIDPSKLVGKRKNLFRILPFDPVTIRQLLYEAKIGDEISSEEAKRLKDTLDKMIRKIECENIYALVRDGENIYLLPYKPSEKTGVEIIFSSSNLFEISEYFIMQLYPKIINKEKKKELLKILHDKEKILKEIKNLEDIYAKYNLILPKLYEKIEFLDEIIRKAREGYSLDYEIDRRKKILYLKVDGVEIPLNYSINPYKAISLAYDELKKIKQGINKLRDKLKELDERISRIERETQEQLFITDERRLMKKQWYEKYVWSISRNGHLIVGGKDARTNEIIVKKYLDDKDLLFHAEIHGSPFVILKDDGGEEDIFDAAIITGSYSKAWKLEVSRINVYYVYKDQVSKKAPSGEYLKTGSFMIYGKKNYVKNIPVKLYIGPITIEDKVRLLIGSLETLTRRSMTNEVFEIRPGKLGREKTASLIVSFYTEREILPREYEKSFLSDLINRLPGKCSVQRITIPVERESND